MPSGVTVSDTPTLSELDAASPFVERHVGISSADEATMLDEGSHDAVGLSRRGADGQQGALGPLPRRQAHRLEHLGVDQPLAHAGLRDVA